MSVGPAASVVIAPLPATRTRASRATLRASAFVVCTRRPPEWVVRRHDPARILRCDESMSIERAARWVGGRAVGLAMSSGGSKTVAHLAVARVLQEADIPVDALTGSSGGALIAASQAVGFSYDRCLRHLREVADLLSVRRWDFNVPPRTGVIKGRRLRDALDRMFEGRTFADALVPFAVVATDLQTGREVVLDRGPLADAMRASMGIPGAFDPWPLDGRLLVDGAIVNPMPADLLRRWGVPIVVGSMVAGKDEAEDAATLTSAPPITQTCCAWSTSWSGS